MGQNTTNHGFYIPEYGEKYDDEKDDDWRDLDTLLGNVSTDGTTFSPDALSGALVGDATLTSLLGDNLTLVDGVLEATDTDTDTDTQLSDAEVQTAVDGSNVDITGDAGSVDGWNVQVGGPEPTDSTTIWFDQA